MSHGADPRLFLFSDSAILGAFMPGKCSLIELPGRLLVVIVFAEVFNSY